MFTKPRLEFKYVSEAKTLENFRTKLIASMVSDPNPANVGYQVKPMIIKVRPII